MKTKQNKQTKQTKTFNQISPWQLMMILELGVDRKYNCALYQEVSDEVIHYYIDANPSYPITEEEFKKIGLNGSDSSLDWAMGCGTLYDYDLWESIKGIRSIHKIRSYHDGFKMLQLKSEMHQNIIDRLWKIFSTVASRNLDLNRGLDL